ncbi:biopolymer transporter ExbD [Malaciobacter molluscorum LMG 25693]|uniref:Biopolymer transporter ExbD n=1 Tax=Malaciobacter molluscorum LMG 25693 TaxID=870501 RepID=A0A2G1DHW6_9BACT|nr:biopolymer transporter ExbD [Malaciobacter molluscorum]AXX92967.1 Tol-Pal system subunit TolR [Malaciobacter molluscorum LMG 25693]PHO18024.1 biopolymer transporter ExbD [Malaciobacter molluscorum LMG 25693]RXJ94919.1 biopolymer transporter ExbD [Malaciobacter molluscorum]
MYDFNQKPELNITPLVDIMLVLLAILMVTAPVMEFEEPVNLPSGSKSRQLENVKKITIFINKNRQVRINKNRYDLKDFPDSFILFAKSKNRNTPIHIRADKTLVYNDVMYVLKTVKEAGFLKVSLITDG